MAEQAKVPAIRFAGFTDPWEQRKLGEVAHFINGRAYSQNELLFSGKYPVLRVGNFYTNDSWYYSDLELEDKNYAYEGDLLYTWSATFGPHIWHGNKVIYHYHIWKVQLEAALEKLFAFQLLERDKERILSDKNGSTMVHITKTGIENTSVLMPCSVEEQRRIGAFFDHLDSIITLHQRKYDKLVVFKKSMLEKMFPKDGESVPEIRFAGFTDPWEQRKASEVFQIVDDRGHPTLPVLSATQNQGMIYRDDSGRYIGHDESNEIGYKRVLPGDFVVHLRSFQGGFAHSQYEGITSPAYTVFRAKEPTSHSDRFWKHWFMSEHFIAGLSTVTYGIRDGRSISVDEFMNTFSAFPAVEEQAAISRLLDYLDDLITLHQRKLELLQNIKKSLLDKMFV